MDVSKNRHPVISFFLGGREFNFKEEREKDSIKVVTCKRENSKQRPYLAVKAIFRAKIIEDMMACSCFTPKFLFKWV